SNSKASNSFAVLIGGLLDRSLFLFKSLTSACLEFFHTHEGGQFYVGDLVRVCGSAQEASVWE
ncbi:hypothetical protein WA026_019370, partial [Henosepilachna vigintioctopunctata]